MPKESSYYTSLLTEYISGTASKEQLNELLDFIRDYPGEYESIAATDELLTLVSTRNEDPDIIITAAAAKRMRERLLDGINGERIAIKHVRVIPIWKRIAAAVAILLVLSLAGYFVLNQNKKPIDIVQNPPALKNDIVAPTSNKARITLANGTIVSLDSVNSGTLAMQGNMKVIKNANGEIAYQSADNGHATEVQYNTLFNPRGSKVIPLTLSDGSQVWLNAESSLRYPTSFTGNERKVEITGEAYFEVAKNASMPFKVGKGEKEITVLGTHFNVNAYDDEEALKITLLEGSVKISTGQKSTLIIPGEQAIVTSEITINHSADLEAVMAWKNGLFHFNSATLPEVLRQLARWYDVDVTYEGTISQMKFGGEITRNTNLSQVLQILEESKVHFKIEGKKIVVLK
jgi:transmembrane sensor